MPFTYGSTRVIATVSAVAALLLCPSRAANPSQCQDIVLTVSASADNVVVPPLPGNATTPAAVNEFLGTATANLALNKSQVESGTFNISARYCPASSPCGGQKEVIELLVHGGSYTKDYWSGGGFTNTSFNGDPYSWIKYASERNYATLSIDELGNGNSSHPDPAEAVQPLLETECIHSVVEQLKAGKIGNTTYSEVLFIGHSFGSQNLARLTQNHPTDPAALILTGYSDDFSGNVPLQVNFGYLPGDLVSTRFADLPGGYLAMSNRTGRSVAFYYNGSYDPLVAVLDFATEGTVAIGEPFGSVLNPVPQYTGPVLLVSGDHDAVVCGIGHDCLAAPGGPSNSTVARTSSFFPNAASFTYNLANSSGHSINFHYSSQQTFGYIHDWIDAKFGGGSGSNGTCPKTSNTTSTASPTLVASTGSAAVNVISFGAVAAGLMAFLL